MWGEPVDDDELAASLLLAFENQVVIDSRYVLSHHSRRVTCHHTLFSLLLPRITRKALAFFPSLL